SSLSPILLHLLLLLFLYNATATTEIHTLSLHDALPISSRHTGRSRSGRSRNAPRPSEKPMMDRSRSSGSRTSKPTPKRRISSRRSEEHTSELQSRENLVCRLLLEKKKKNIKT